MRHRLAEERGTVATMVAVAVPVLILFLALAMDIGNWYVKKRHLQNRVDAAAFAAGVEYGFRFPECIGNPTQADLIATKAKEFAGATGTPADVNTGINANITATVNSTSIDAGTDGTDGGGPCFDHAPNGADFSNPQGGYWTDVKAKESNVASLFGGFGVPVPVISARARVGLFRPESLSGMQPFAIADPNLTECAWARFRRESSSQVVSTIPLVRQGSSNTWSGTQGVSMDGNYLRADIVLGSCSDSAERIVYSNVGFVDDYPDNERGVAIRRVEVSGNTCNGQYIFRENGSCTISINAEVWFSCPHPPDEPEPEKRVYARVRGNLIPLGGSHPFWSGSLGSFSPGSGASGGNPPGSLPIGIRVQCDSSLVVESSPHQAVMAGNDSHEGPMQNVTLAVTSVDAPPHMQTVTLELKPLRSAQLGDLRVPIRGAAPLSGNFMSGAVACGANGPSNVTGSTGSVSAGCNGPFAPTFACVAGATCSLTVLPGGGSGSGALLTAYNSAWCGARNNWGSYPNTISRGDPRLITVAVNAPGAAFSDSGGAGNSQAITRFAGFYVTGWEGQSCGSPNPGNDPRPPAINTTSAGAIWGHFVKFVVPPSEGTPTEQTCEWAPPNDRDDVALCIAALVR